MAKVITDKYGNIVERHHDDGTITDKHGKITGHQDNYGNRSNAYGKDVGKVHEDGTITDQYGKITGEYTGSIRREIRGG